MRRPVDVKAHVRFLSFFSFGESVPCPSPKLYLHLVGLPTSALFGFAPGQTGSGTHVGSQFPGEESPDRRIPRSNNSDEAPRFIHWFFVRRPRFKQRGRNDDAIRQVAREKPRVPALWKESCCLEFPCPIRDVSGPHDNSQHIQKVVASDDFRSLQ